MPIIAVREGIRPIADSEEVDHLVRCAMYPSPHPNGFISGVAEVRLHVSVTSSELASILIQAAADYVATQTAPDTYSPEEVRLVL